MTNNDWKPIPRICIQRMSYPRSSNQDDRRDVEIRVVDSLNVVTTVSVGLRGI